VPVLHTNLLKARRLNLTPPAIAAQSMYRSCMRGGIAWQILEF